MSPAQRPWWGNPLLWVGVSAVFVLLGLFVAPKLFGFAFLFLPFIWIRRWGGGDGRWGTGDGGRSQGGPPAAGD